MTHRFKLRPAYFPKGQNIPDDSSYPFLHPWQACLIDHCRQSGTRVHSLNHQAKHFIPGLSCAPFASISRNSQLCHILNDLNLPGNDPWILKDTDTGWLAGGRGEWLFLLENSWILCGTERSWSPPHLGWDPGVWGGGRCKLLTTWYSGRSTGFRTRWTLTHLWEFWRVINPF